MDTIAEEVKDLYHFRDQYFATHDPQCYKDKEKDVQTKMVAVVSKIDGLKDEIPKESRGQYHFLKGRALNVQSTYSNTAEEELGRATKYNIPDAWNELGECLFKKSDVQSAKTCFQKAIENESKAVYLRNMSVLMRSLPWSTPDERRDSVEKVRVEFPVDIRLTCSSDCQLQSLCFSTKGLEFARAALKKDLKDGQSWLVLGNAYLASFFTGESKLELLRNAKSSYLKAEEDTKTAMLPELHFSKFQIEWYEEDYANALRSLTKCQSLEPSWVDPQEKHSDCKKFLSRLSHLVQSKGQLNTKKTTALLKGLDSSHLGPYETGGTNLTGGQKPELVQLSQLSLGSNQDKIVLGKAVCSVVPESGIPFAFCLLDKEVTCMAVTVYNWPSKFGVKVGDAVAIVAPILKRHTFPEQEQIGEFSSIRVTVPVMLVINKRCVSVNQVATSQVVSQYKAE